MVLLEICWTILISSSVVLHCWLTCKPLLPRLVRDLVRHGKLKPNGGGGGGVGGGMGLAAVISSLNVPKSYFTHFYAWGVVWNWTILVWFTFSCLLPTSIKWPPLPLIDRLTPFISFVTEQDVVAKCRQGMSEGGSLSQIVFDIGLVLLLVCIQVLRRLYECLFVNTFSGSRMHLLHYLLGLFFYTALPLTALLHLDTDEGSELTSTPASLRWYHLVGVNGFLWASLRQWQCHGVLARLRSQAKGASSGSPRGGASSRLNETYYLPRGNWFEYVSCPHYLAEILIYTFLLLLLAPSRPLTPWWLVLGFTVSVLAMSARESHAWYLSKFDDCPKNWRRLFPFVW